MISLPTRQGWLVEWYSGKSITVRGKTIRLKDTFETTDRAKAEQKAEDLKAKGFEIAGIYECIF